MIRYTRQHEDEVISMYVEEELSLSEIHKAAGVLPQTAWKILVRRGVPRRPVGVGRPMPQLPTNDLERTIWLHRQGLTYDQIGEILGLSEGGVKHRITVARQRLGYGGTTRGTRSARPIPRHVERAVASWR